MLLFLMLCLSLFFIPYIYFSLIQMDEKEKELKEKLDLDKERKDRSIEEMSQEANEYRKLF